MKLFFQCVVPPILLIAGFVVMKNTNTSTVQSGGSNLEIGPQMYLQQRSNPGKEILIQNATSGDINKLLKSFDDEKLKYRNIKSLGNLMAVAPHSVAYGVQYVNSTGQVRYLLL